MTTSAGGSQRTKPIASVSKGVCQTLMLNSVRPGNETHRCENGARASTQGPPVSQLRHMLPPEVDTQLRTHMDQPVQALGRFPLGTPPAIATQTWIASSGTLISETENMVLNGSAKTAASATTASIAVAKQVASGAAPSAVILDHDLRVTALPALTVHPLQREPTIGPIQRWVINAVRLRIRVHLQTCGLLGRHSFHLGVADILLLATQHRLHADPSTPFLLGRRRLSEVRRPVYTPADMSWKGSPFLAGIAREPRLPCLVPVVQHPLDRTRLGHSRRLARLQICQFQLRSLQIPGSSTNSLRPRASRVL